MQNPFDMFLDEGILDEVLGRLKSGKEADVYLVRQGERTLAAKVYKDRSQRSFKNNADYKEGRGVRNSRTARAMASRSRFGARAAEQAWKSTEAETLSRLHMSGVRVPQLVMFYEGVLLMELVTDVDGYAAPRLIDLSFDASTARATYEDLRSQIVRMLCCEVIHGDLSPYNILLGEKGPTIIDFPQTVSAAHSSRSEFFFQRDFDNVLQFFSNADRSLLPHRQDGRRIWQAYVRRELSPDYVPPLPSREPDRRPQQQQARPRQQPRPQQPRPQQQRPQQQHPRPRPSQATTDGAPRPSRRRSRRRPRR